MGTTPLAESTTGAPEIDPVAFLSGSWVPSRRWPPVWFRSETKGRRSEGTVDLVGEGGRVSTPEAGSGILAGRSSRKDLAPNAALPEDTRLWAALQLAGGGTWGGCVYDAEGIMAKLANGQVTG